MDKKEFHNALKVMASIDMDELVNAGVIQSGDFITWGEFRENPYHFFICSADDVAKRIWGVLMERMMGNCIKKGIKEDKTMTDYMPIDVETIEETDEAVLFDDGDGQFWVPKSCMEEWPDIGDSGVAMVAEWFCEKEGLC